MSTAIPPNPNGIIASLLEVAQAAYVLAYHPSQDLLDNLKKQLDLLEDLPQYCSNPVNGPCRARKYLESFLQASALSDLMEKRTRAFPKMTITLAGTPEQQEALKDMLRSNRNQPLQAGEFVEGVNMKTVPISMLADYHGMASIHPVPDVPYKSVLDSLPADTAAAIRANYTTGADVQRDGIEFEPQEWKAPATGPGFTPTAEFPASGPISHDFYTHRSAWRDIIVKCIEHTKAGRAGAVHFREELDEDVSYLEHELRAFDRAFDTLPPLHASQANAVSGDTERRMRPRFVEPIKPEASDTRPVVEATRPLFEKAMKSHGYRAEIDELGLYKGLTEHRWEGWCDAVESMGFRKSEAEDIGSMREARAAMDAVCDALTKHAPGWQALTSRGMDSAVQAIEQLATTAKNEIRTNMLADTADEALKIINDAALLRDLADLLSEPFSRLTIGQFKGIGWCIEMNPSTLRTGTRYESTSFHQVIAVASKGEHDRRFPEHEECKFCGFTVETPCDAPPPAECPTALEAQTKDQQEGLEQAIQMAENMHKYGTIDEPKQPASLFTNAAIDAARIAKTALEKSLTGRERMEHLAVAIKDVFGVTAAKDLIKKFVPPAAGVPALLRDIPDAEVQNMTAACEEMLKKVIE